MRMRKKKVQELGILLFFKALLEVAYVLFVNPYYEYRGFTLELNKIIYFEGAKVVVANRAGPLDSFGEGGY